VQIVFESDEYLVQVTGTQGIAYGTLTLVTSLTLITNKRSYGPYGDKYSTGTSFQTHPNAQVLGFHGWCGWMVDQLGAFMAQPSRPVCAGEAWGGAGGSAFYEGRGEIGQITVVYCTRANAFPGSRSRTSKARELRGSHTWHRTRPNCGGN
jgi:hypothetical protein